MTKNQLRLIRSPFFLFLLTFSILIQYSFAQTGTLDSSLNSNGILPGNSDMVFAVQGDGKIVKAETYTLFNPYRSYLKIARFHVNGMPDDSFGNNGFVLNEAGGTNKSPKRLKLCQDGKILILAGNGPESYFLIRYLPGGQIDSSFNTTGVRTLGSSPQNAVLPVVTLQSDGKVLLGGSYRVNNDLSSFFIMRLNTDGSTDLSFGLAGIVTTVFSIHISLPQQSIIYTDGSSINDMVVQQDQKIIAVGIAYMQLNGVISDSIAVVRYDRNGTLDSSFNGNGKIVINPPNPYNINRGSGGSHANNVVLQADGKILVGATLSYLQSHGRWMSGNPGLLRFNINGSLDQSFNGNGIKAITGGNSNNKCVKIALQSDGKIVLAGLTGDVDFLNSKFFMARIKGNGSNDNNFGQGGIIVPLFTDVNNYPTRSGVSEMELKGHRIYCNIWTYMSTSGSGIFAYKNDDTSLNPKSLQLCNSGTTLINAEMSGTNYQWQMSTDSVQFDDISNSSNFTGVNTPTLSFTNIPASWRGYQFRCTVDGGSGTVTTIQFSNEWTGAVTNEWENSANWLCGTVPGLFEDAIINSGNVIINSNVTINSILIKPGASLTVGTGYTLTVLK